MDKNNSDNKCKRVEVVQYNDGIFADSRVYHNGKLVSINNGTTIINIQSI